MPRDVFEIETDLAPEDVQFVDNQLHEFNMATTGIHDAQMLGLFVRDAAGAIEAGLVGWTWGDCCRIDKLWVREDRRRGGLGRRLVAAAEQEAVRRGCCQVTLETHSFQAPDFYRKLGYEQWAVLDGYPTPHQHCYLRKRISAEPG